MDMGQKTAGRDRYRRTVGTVVQKDIEVRRWEEKMELKKQGTRRTSDAW